jgi:hypothetical protein
MVCPKCNYEFCWDCLDHMPGSQHDYGHDCPFRVIGLYGQMSLLAVLICSRLIISACYFLFSRLIKVAAVVSLIHYYSIFRMQMTVEGEIRNKKRLTLSLAPGLLILCAVISQVDEIVQAAYFTLMFLRGLSYIVKRLLEK